MRKLKEKSPTGHNQVGQFKTYTLNSIKLSAIWQAYYVIRFILMPVKHKPNTYNKY